MAIEYRSKRHRDGQVEVRLFFSAAKAWTEEAAWPEHHLAHLSLHLQGILIMEARLGPGIAPQPFFAVRLDDVKPGELLEIRWRTNHDEKGRLEIRLP